MKKMIISQRKSLAVTILVLTVIFLAPIAAPAGEATFQKHNIHNMLPKKMGITPFRLYTDVSGERFWTVVAELEVDILLPGHNRIVKDLAADYISRTARQWEAYLI